MVTFSPSLCVMAPSVGLDEPGLNSLKTIDPLLAKIKKKAARLRIISVLQTRPVLTPHQAGNRVFLNAVITVFLKKYQNPAS